MFDYMARGNLGVVSAIQSREELIPVLEVIKAQSPSTVLEIGTANGGTLFLLTRVAAPDATIVSLDLPGGDWGGGYSEKRIPLYEAFALPEQRLCLLREDSHTPQALDHVKHAFSGRTIDFLFIDGDHSYEGVRSDFEMYAPLVTPGGYIAFHDIAYTDGVARLWDEVKPSFAQAREFVAPKGQAFGIGLGMTRP
jgi:cephalosporin hydroxylase